MIPYRQARVLFAVLPAHLLVLLGGRRRRLLDNRGCGFSVPGEEERHDALKAVFYRLLRVLPLSRLHDEVELSVCLHVLGGLVTGKIGGAYQTERDKIGRSVLTP